MKNSQFDFTIVGAGLSGIIAGIELLKLNKTCLILERRKELTRPLCGEYLTPKGCSLLNELGLQDILKGFNPLFGMDLISPKGKKIQTSFPENKFGLSLDRQVLHTRLISIFENLGGVILWDIQIEKIEILENVKIQTNQSSFYSNWLIGADGRQSQVARLARLDALESPHKKVALHCYLKPKKKMERYGMMCILPGGDYIGINPISHLEVNFSMVTELEEIKKAGGVKNLLNFWIKNQKILSEYFSPISHEEVKTISPITRSAGKISAEKVTLIGDASGFIDPLTGEGMTTAIATATLLCEEIKINQDVQMAFNSYEKKRKTEFRQKEKFNLVLQKIIKIEVVCEIIALLLESSVRLRSLFIGVIGNIYTPKIAMKKLFAPSR